MLAACSSVYAFNRIGAALRFLIQHVLKGTLTVFYDDFPFLETPAGSQLMEMMTSRFLSLLGWRHAKMDAKDVPPFSGSLQCVGCRAQSW